jgi:hypothetical protein
MSPPDEEESIKEGSSDDGSARNGQDGILHDDYGEMGVTPPAIPIQAMIDPETGRNITGEIITESRIELEGELERILNQAREGVRNGEDPGALYVKLIKLIEQELTQHFQRQKLPVHMGMIQEYSKKLIDALEGTE